MLEDKNIPYNDTPNPIKITIVKLMTSSPIDHPSRHLRGFFANQFPEFSLLHNHNPDGSRIQGYPLIQYKILNEIAYIVGIEDGATLLPHIVYNFEKIILGYESYTIIHREVITTSVKVEGTNNPCRYQFLTPWLSLNTINLRKYQKLNNLKDQEKMLSKILLGNCLSLAKSLNIFIHQKLTTKIILSPVDVNFKENHFIGFTGVFEVNFHIPDLLGLGKSVSQGYGTVQSRPYEEER